MRRRALLLVGFALVVASCGGGDDGAAIAEAIADGMMEGAGEDSPFDRSEADCFGEEVVDRMGVDRLVSVGLSLEEIENGAEPGSVDLSGDDLDDMTDAMTACIDFGRLVVDGMVAELPISDASADCLAGGINQENFLRDIAESSLRGEDPSPEVQSTMTSTLFGLIDDCFTPEEMELLGDF